MKILFVTNSIGMEGASVALINILQYSKENNITPFVTCPKKGEFSDTLDKLGIPFLIIGNPLEIYPKVYSWKAFIKYPYSFLLMLVKRHKAFDKLCFCIEKFKPNIIHTNVGAVQIGFLAAKKYGIPHVWHIREYQKEDFNMSPFPSMNIFKKRIHDANNHCICITKDIFLHFNMAISKDKIIYDGVIDKGLVQPFNETKKKYILFAGRLEDAKGCKELIKAFNIYAKKSGLYDLLIAGVGNKKYIEECKILMDNEIQNRVHFLGAVSHEEVFRLMYDASIYVVPSRNEGFGFVTAEAMFNGTIVIGKNTGGTKEQFNNAYDLTGEDIAFRYNTDEQLPQKLLECENLQKKHYMQLAIKGQQVVCELYDIGTQSKKIYDFLMHLNNQRKFND